MGIHVTSRGWAERLRWPRRPPSSRLNSGRVGLGPAWQPSTTVASVRRDDTREIGSRRSGDARPYEPEIRRHQLSVLGLHETASAEDISAAHRRLVSDLTPGPDANHGRVELALAMLEEVDQAYRWLKLSAVA